AGRLANRSTRVSYEASGPMEGASQPDSTAKEIRSKWRCTMNMRLTLGTISCAAMLCAATAAFAQKASDADKDFAKKAMEGGNAEIQLGKLAQQKSNSEDVKHFGEKMVTDHTKLNEDMAPIAQNLGVTPPTGTGMADKAEEAKLKMMSG